MRILVCSDLHLDWVTAGYVRYDDVCNAMDEIFEVAVAGHYDAVFCLGDISDPDSPRCWAAASYVIRFDQRLEAEGIERLWVGGNHDVVEDGTGCSVLSPLAATGARVALVPRCYVYKRTVAVVALPYTAKVDAYDPGEAVRSFATEDQGLFSDVVRKGGPIIVAGHLNIAGIAPGSETTDMPRGREVMYPLLEINEHWPKALKLDGHYHAQQVYQDVHIPGALERLTLGERHHRPGYLSIEV